MKKEEILSKLKRYERIYSGDMKSYLRDVRLFIIDEAEQFSETEEKLKRTSEAVLKKYNPILIDYATADVLCNFCNGQGVDENNVKHDKDCIVLEAQNYLNDNITDMADIEFKNYPVLEDDL